MNNIVFVLAVGRGKTLDKSIFLINSIKKYHPDAEIYSFVAEEETEEIDYAIKSFEEISTKVLYGEIPMKEYIFTVKHNALIKAGKITKKKYLCCLDSDMLLLQKFRLPPNHDMYVCPVDVGNTSWGREESREKWEELYKIAKAKMPKKKLYSLVDNREMFPYYNGGFVITSDKQFGKKWLDLTSKIFKIIESYDSYDKYRSQSKRRRLFTRIPYSHWTEQVSLTLLASKYNTLALGYDYDYPLNAMKSCPKNTKLIHYHDFRNLYKLESHRLQIDVYEYLINNYNKTTSKLKLKAYDFLRKIKIKMGKF